MQVLLLFKRGVGLPALAKPRPTTRLTLQEAARDSRIGYSTLRKRVAEGLLPAERVGRRVFIRPEHLAALSSPPVGRPTLERAVDDAVARVVAAAPRLTPDQRERLASILGGAE